MAKKTNILTEQSIKKKREYQQPGRYHDGDGLYIQVRAESKSWLYRYKRNGKAFWKGLGTYPKVGLKKARDRANECYQLRKDGIDPITHFKELDKQAELEGLKGTTFKKVAIAHIESKKSEWSNAKHGQQWTNTLDTYVYPTIGHLPVEDIDTPLVLKVLEPIWRTKTETASRVRQRIEAVLNRAIALRYREPPNPAVWRGSLENLLPKPTKIREVQHQPSMPYKYITNYYGSINDKVSASGLALRMIILSCVRSKEARGAHIDEFDLANRVWTIPASRMKGTVNHRYAHAVPLTDEMINIVNQTEMHRRGGYLFPGTGNSPFVSDTAVRKLLHRKHPTLSIHGFRSTFRTWAGEVRHFESEVCEMCLAHKIESAIVLIYNRTEYLEKRRDVMKAWTDYCLHGDKIADVVPIQRKAK
jgi:integrase